MTKKYLLLPLALLIVAGTAASAEAFSFRGLLERLHLIRSFSTSTRPMNPNASSTAPWVRGEGRKATGTMPFFGTVSSVSDTSLVIKLDRPNSIPGARGAKFASSTLPSTLIINLTADTIYASGTKASLVAGVKVSGQAKINEDKSLTAIRIHINPPRDGLNRPEKPDNNRGEAKGWGRFPKR
ncbi:MAG: hypothetical protein WC385_03665 [Candidatus Paceibacterota bacterium]